MLQFFVRPGQSGRESFRFGHSVIATILCGLAAVASQAAEPKLLKVPADKDWKIEIIPGPAIGPSPVPKIDRAVKQAQAVRSEGVSEVVPAGTEAALPAGLTSASYMEVYNSIPFRRNEYEANPNYRHEATIELLLGQVRPKTVTNVSVSTPAATCCSPRTAGLWPWVNPWGAKNFYYHYHYSRPTGYWVW